VPELPWAPQVVVPEVPWAPQVDSDLERLVVAVWVLPLRLFIPIGTSLLNARNVPLFSHLGHLQAVRVREDLELVSPVGF